MIRRAIVAVGAVGTYAVSTYMAVHTSYGDVTSTQLEPIYVAVVASIVAVALIMSQWVAQK